MIDTDSAVRADLGNPKLVKVVFDGLRPPSVLLAFTLSLHQQSSAQLAIDLLTRQRIPVYATNALQEGLGRAFFFYTRRTCTAPRLALVPPSTPRCSLGGPPTHSPARLLRGTAQWKMRHEDEKISGGLP